MENQITGLDIQDAVTHWLQTPTNGYYGSDYGQDPKAMLQNPMSSGVGDDYLRKLRSDVLALGLLPPSQVQLYAVPSDFDAMQIMLAIADAVFEVPNVK